MNLGIDLKDRATYIFNKYYPNMLARAMSIVQDSDVAKDIVSGVFDCFLKNNWQYDENKAKSYFLIRVQYACLDFFRQEKARRKKINLYQINHSEKFEQEPTAEEADPDFGEKLLRFCVNGKNFNKRQTAILKMSFINGASNSEISEQLGISLNAVKVSKYKAIKAIRKFIKTGKFREQSWRR